jgi:hypothetical protein
MPLRSIPGLRPEIPQCSADLAPGAHYFHLAVIVTMIAVWMVQMSVYQIVGVPAMWNRFMSAGRSVPVAPLMFSAIVLWSALLWIVFSDVDFVLLYMLRMRMVEVSIMQVIFMPFVHYGCMSAIRTMLVGMAFMHLMFFGHMSAP